MLETQPIKENIGTEIRGVDLSGQVSDRDFDVIYDAWLSTTVLLFPDQKITPDQQIAFTKRFGEIVAYYDPTERAVPDHPEILLLSNLDHNGKLTGKSTSAYLWHADGHYLEEPPCGSLLYARMIPPTGGDTWFTNTQRAYELLPETTKDRIAGKKLIISRVRSRPYNFPEKPPPTPQQIASWPDVSHEIAKLHPVTGKRSLYVGSNVPWLIEGMSEEESTPLITELQAHAVQPDLVYKHKWRVGDLVMWDNMSSMHKANPYPIGEFGRIMHRTTIAAGTYRYGLPEQLSKAV